jgi:hypothetical protein
MPQKCAQSKTKNLPLNRRAIAAVDLYPGLTGKLPRSESIAQLSEFVLALYGRLSELASAARAFEEATADSSGFEKVYPPYHLRPQRPQKPVGDAPPLETGPSLIRQSDLIP